GHNGNNGCRISARGTMQCRIHRRLAAEDHTIRLVTRKQNDCSRPREHPAVGDNMSSCKAQGSEFLDRFIVRLDNIPDISLRSYARIFGCRVPGISGTFTTFLFWFRHTCMRKAINKAGVHKKAVAFDHNGIARNSDPLADGRNQTVVNDYRRLFQLTAGRLDDGSVYNGVGSSNGSQFLWLLLLSRKLCQQ